MDIFVFLSTFVKRIRYKLIFGTVLAVAITWYFSGFIPKRYNLSTTIFTGITSKATLDDLSGRTDWNSSNNAHDNIINIVKSKNVLDRVSIGLISQGLMYGDPKKDNNYISASNYKKLLNIMSDEVKALVDKNSFENTFNKLLNYREEDKTNSIYAVFNWEHPYYSFTALSKIKVFRKGASDMIEISYECTDPGIGTNTLELLNKELTLNYETLMLSASNDVVKHFEEQLAIAAKKLSVSEDGLVEFNIQNKIINYEEQTKHLAAMNNAFEARYDEAMLINKGSERLLVKLEAQMDTRTKLFRENETFLANLDDVSSLNGRIAEIEIFGEEKGGEEKLGIYKSGLAKSEQLIKQISDSIDIYKYSKEGVVITDIVGEWLTALLNYEKTKSEIKVLDQRRKEIQDQYVFFSPVGPNIARKDREVRVDEEAYLTILHHLGLAKLKQKNILLDAGTLQIVSPPEFPLITEPRKRELYVIAAFIGAIAFIAGIYLLIEILDRTIRDKGRAERLSSGKVIGAFPAGVRLKYRRFAEQIRRISLSCLVNILNGYIKKDKPMIINLLSIEPQEGKSYIADQLVQYWSERGFSVMSVSYHNELKHESKEFIKALSIYDQIENEKKSEADIVIAEYGALKDYSVPLPLLKEASVNLLILDAQRVWKPRDREIFDHLRQVLGEESIFIYLNKADEEAVEQFTGQLPPYTMLRNLSHRLFYFGITAKK